MEVWTEEPCLGRQQTRGLPETSLRPTQRISYQDGKSMVCLMVLSFESIFRRPPDEHEGDIVLDACMLGAIYQETSCMTTVACC